MGELRDVVVALRVTAPHSIASVLPFDFAATPYVVFDLSEDNQILSRYDLSDPASFSEYIFGEMENRNATVGVGRYDEKRVIYRHSPLFANEDDPRTVHLGVDLFSAAGTQVRAPLEGIVHSFADNSGLGNYGPTVVLEHGLAGIQFFTLYGHLSGASIARHRVGSRVGLGTRIGWIGESWENGGWPPHLHFQIITDIGGWRGDFPGVASPSERQHFLALCPDPNLILGIPGISTRRSLNLENET